jgi:hypothetical protein
MTREERRLWVLNDEGLYNLQRKSGKSLDKFLKEDKKIIEEVADNVTTSKKPAHYIAYPRK